MQLAAYSGDERTAKLLKEKGAPIEEVDPEGKTPLHWAVRNDNTKVIKFLMENGADINKKTTEGRCMGSHRDKQVRRVGACVVIEINKSGGYVHVWT